MSILISSTAMFDGVTIAACDFTLRTRQEFSRSAGGVNRALDLGPAVWEATYTTAPLTLIQSSSLLARLNSLDGGMGAFEGYDFRRLQPALSTFVGTPTTAEISHLDSGDARRMRFDGVPEGFTISPGDYLSFAYGDPAAQALHQVTTTAVADGSGVMPYFNVRPYIRPGAAVNAPVRLRRAFARFNLVPGSISVQQVGGVLYESVTWSAIQEII